MNVLAWVTDSMFDGWNLQPRHAQRLEAAVPGLRVTLCPDREVLLAKLAGAEALLTWRFKPEWFAQAPRLRLLITPAAGRDFLPFAPPPGIRVVHGHFHGELMAETAVGMMLGICRGILPATRAQNRGDPWPRPALRPFMRAFRGSHVAVLGFGHIGQWVARLAKPFGVRITGLRRNLTADRPAFFDPRDDVRPVTQLHDVLPTTDFLVITLPGDTSTDRLVGAAELARLPRHAVIVNIGRGNAIDEEALAAALRAGTLAAACLDVFRTEPLPVDSPLRAAPNFHMMPHASAIAPNYLDLFVEELIRDGVFTAPAACPPAGTRADSSA